MNKYDFNANLRKSNADGRKFICGNPRAICEHLRSTKII